MIQVEGLTKDYGPRRAIEDLSFSAQKGEIVGFLGPNGAGKTTTMRILTGFMPPTSGQASVAGYDVVDESIEVRKRVGYLPENVPLYDDLTVWDYLKYMADLHKVEDAEDRIYDIIELVGMGDRSESYISALSKGMRQRIGLAQALVHEPEVLILDEPTIGLDPSQIRGVRALIQEIGKERTVMLSTHILSEAQQICDRVLIINKGQIVAEDTPKNLQSRLAGAQRVAVQVAGDEDGLDKVIGGVKGVASASVTGAGTVEFETEAGKDVRPDVARQIIKKKYDLLEMRPMGMSLEDIFIEVTREDPAPPDLDDDFDGEEEA